MKIKIKYFDNAKELNMIEKGNWCDLYANKDMFIPEGEKMMIPLGVAMQLPEGYEAHVVPRSSTFKTWGIIQTNNIGIIDNSYCGDNDQWFYPAYCLEPKEEYCDSIGTWVHKGDKIAQFRIIEVQPKLEFEKVELLGNKDRGGFGSTGSK